MTSNLGNRRWPTERWEEHLGEQVRRARQNEQLSQADLARRANVNRNSISSLERGEGSTLATLIRVVRVLGRADWLDDLAPDPGPSPLALLREQQAKNAQSSRRVRSADSPRSAHSTSSADSPRTPPSKLPQES